MDIHIPKNSETGGQNNQNWNVVNNTSSMTQREQLRLFEEYLSAISKKTKELDEKIQDFTLFKNQTEDKVRETLKVTNNTNSLVYFGFFALVFVVLGIAYGYWQFIFTSSKNEDYRYGISEKINSQKQEIENLKNCLSFSKWLNPKCLQN